MLLPLAEVLKYQPSRSVYERFLHAYPMPKEEAELIFEDCQRFLWLVAKKDQERLNDPSVPDIFISKGMRIIDEMWHCFILYTEFYTNFCHKYLGGFIHHPPLIHKFYENEKKIGKERSNEILVSELIDCVYEELGEEVAVRWFDTYVKKYDYENMMH